MSSGDGDLGLASAADLSPNPGSPRTTRRGSKPFIAAISTEPPIRPSNRLRRSSSASKTLGSPTRARSYSRFSSHFKGTIPLPQIYDVEVLFRLRRWLLCFAVVLFDLDEGPVLDGLVPYDVAFDEQELAAIPFLSMPDSNAMQFDGTRYTSFSWRLPRTGKTGESLYGHVSFMQRADKAVDRGYVQRSLVLITTHDLHGLFTTIVNSLGPLQTRSPADGSTTLEIAIHNIARWPAPTADGESGSLVDLQFLNSVITVDLPGPAQPQAHDGRATTAPRISRTAILAANPITPLSLLFKDSLGSLWLLYELLITAEEPLLVYAPNDASKVSELVHWMTRLTLPIRYSGDWRPLFTVHAADYAQLVDRKRRQPGLLLGVTSPLIFGVCAHFHHVLTAGYDPGQHHHLMPGHRHHRIVSSSSFREAVSNVVTTDTSDVELKSSRKRMVRRDSDFLKSVEARLKLGDCASCATRMTLTHADLAADALLIRHFASLTNKLLLPIDRYITTMLMPTASADALAAPEPTRQFSRSGFLSSLKTFESPFPLRRTRSTTSNVVAFYERVMNGAWPRTASVLTHTGANFAPWLATRMKTADQAIRERYVAGLATGDVHAWTEKHATTEIDDLIVRINTEVRISQEATRQHAIRRRSKTFSEDLGLSRAATKAEERARQLALQAERLAEIRRGVPV